MGAGGPADVGVVLDSCCSEPRKSIPSWPNCRGTERRENGEGGRDRKMEKERGRGEESDKRVGRM